jgi:hypothetical protein
MDTFTQAPPCLTISGQLYAAAALPAQHDCWLGHGYILESWTMNPYFSLDFTEK